MDTQEEGNVLSMPTQSRMEVVTITPDIARNWLDANLENRPVRETTIKRYVEAIKSGQWELNGETIKFSEKGVLLDGQHRLRAVVQSGLPIKSYVIFDLPRRVFDTIDTGATRTIGDLLALQGEINSKVLGTALRILYIHDQFGSASEAERRLARLVTHRDLLETLGRHPNIEHSISFVSGIPSIKRYISIPVAAYCHYLFSKIQQHQADAFFIRLAKGADVEDGSPLQLLRSRLENMSKATSKDRIEAMAIIIKAWNAMRTKKPMASLRWSKVEDFPEAV